MKKSLLILSLAIMSFGAQANVSQCKAIRKLPYVISTSGIYCLKKSLAFGTSDSPVLDGVAITILADNVTLDMNGFGISGDDSGYDVTTTGVLISGADQVIVRNGKISGFQTGVYGEGSTAATVIEGMIFSRNRSAGITMNSENAIIRNNAVYATGNSTAAANSPAFGICPAGDRIRVLGNIVKNVEAVGTGMAVGIGCQETANGLIVEGNSVADVNSPSGSDVGIYFYNSTIRNLAVNNRVSSTGISCIGYGGTGVYMGNLVDGCSNDYTGTGTAAGSTNY